MAVVPLAVVPDAVAPLYDRLLVRQDDESEVAKEVEGPDGKRIAIVTAEDHREKPYQGTVLAVGEGRLMDNGTVVPLKVNIGDRVIFGRFNGVDLPENLGLGKNIKIMREDEIMAVRK